MHHVVIGVPAEGLLETNAARCAAADNYLRWDGEHLFIKVQDGEERWVVPWPERRELVKYMAM
jgi:hypothetical protein